MCIQAEALEIKVYTHSPLKASTHFSKDLSDPFFTRHDKFQVPRSVWRISADATFENNYTVDYDCFQK